MSSSNKEEKSKSSKPNNDSNQKNKLESNINGIIDTLSKNAGSGTSPQAEEYEYVEYEIEEYEEEEEEEEELNTNKSPSQSSPKGTFMTQNILTMHQSPRASPLEQENNMLSPSNTKRKRRVIPAITTPKIIDDDTNVEEKLDHFIQDGKLPDIHSTQPVINLINRRKVEALYSSDYESAEVYDNAVQSLLIKENTKLNPNMEKEEKQQTYEERQQYLQDKLSQTEEYYKIQIERNNIECERRLEAAEKRHQAEIDEFKENWKNPEYLKQFGKPSSRMLDMRYVEKKLVLAKRYTEAISQRKLGDEQQMKETDNLQKFAEKHMRNDYARLREKQKGEIEKIEARFDTLNAEIEARMKRDAEIIKTAQKNNEANLTIGRQKWSNLNSPIRAPQSSLPTPRTQKKLDRFKSNRNVQIVLTPFDDETLANLPVFSFRSEKYRKSASSLASRSSTALSTGRSSVFASARSRSSAQKPKTTRRLNASFDSGSRSRFPNLNS